MRNEGETHLVLIPQTSDIFCLPPSTVFCENSKRYLAVQPNFTQSGQSLCHHIIYHILWVVEMGGSVKITSPRVVILS